MLVRVQKGIEGIESPDAPTVILPEGGRGYIPLCSGQAEGNTEHRKPRKQTLITGASRIQDAVWYGFSHSLPSMKPGEFFFFGGGGGGGGRGGGPRLLSGRPSSID